MVISILNNQSIIIKFQRGILIKILALILFI